jgi:hypothetical protein
LTTARGRARQFQFQFQSLQTDHPPPLSINKTSTNPPHPTLNHPTPPTHPSTRPLGHSSHLAQDLAALQLPRHIPRRCIHSPLLLFVWRRSPIAASLSESGKPTRAIQSPLHPPSHRLHHPSTNPLFRFIVCSQTCARPPHKQRAVPALPIRPDILFELATSGRGRSKHSELSSWVTA